MGSFNRYKDLVKKNGTGEIIQVLQALPVLRPCPVGQHAACYQ